MGWGTERDALAGKENRDLEPMVLHSLYRDGFPVCVVPRCKTDLGFIYLHVCPRFMDMVILNL